MQPKGNCQYIFDSVTNVWVPWEGTAVGFGGVTLFTTNGIAIDTPTGLSEDFATTRILGTAAFLYAVDNVSGLVWDRLRSYLLNADALAVPAASLGVSSFPWGFNGTTFDRLRSFAGNADNVTAPTLGLLGSASFPFGFDGTNYDRLRCGASDSDTTIVGVTSGIQQVAALSCIFDGSSFKRWRAAAQGVLGSFLSTNGALVSLPGEWSITHTPAANTQATISRAAGGANVRHVCSSITATLLAPAGSVSGTVLINLRDGATGAGTILWSQSLLVGGATSVSADRAIIELSGLHIVGTANTAMTLEFSAAGGANTVESVALTGFDSGV